MERSTQQPPSARDAYECQSSTGFLWSLPLLSAALNKLLGHNLLLLSFLQRDRGKDICYFRQEAYWKSTHTIRTAQCKIIRFSCNQKKGEKTGQWGGGWGRSPISLWTVFISEPVFEEGACCYLCEKNIHSVFFQLEYSQPRISH